MFKTILKAIALRIGCACNEKGIAPLTIPSEIKRFALHVKQFSHTEWLKYLNKSWAYYKAVVILATIALYRKKIA